MDPEEIARWVILGGGVLGAFATATAFTRRGFRWLRRMIATTRQLVQRFEAVADLAEAQLSPNGGSSLLDKVNRIEGNHQAAEKHWQRLGTSLDGLNRRVEKLEHQLATSREVE